MLVKVRVYGLRGEETTIDLCDTEEQLKSITVLQLKKMIEFTFGENCDRLVCGSQILEEHTLLSDRGIKHMSTIHTIVKLPGV